MPKMSYTAPKRGDRLVQVGISIGPNVRAAVKRPPGRKCVDNVRGEWYKAAA